MGKNSRLLIDGDIPLYQVAFSCEVPTDWGMTSGPYTLIWEKRERLLPTG